MGGDHKLRFQVSGHGCDYRVSNLDSLSYVTQLPQSETVGKSNLLDLRSCVWVEITHLCLKSLVMVESLRSLGSRPQITQLLQSEV